MAISYSIKKFDELSLIDLYYILQARSQVFVVEQNCTYQDIDDLDFDSLHLVAHQNKTLVGYCRIIPPDIVSEVDGIKANPSPRIGRVLVLPENRGLGIARNLMVTAIKHCQTKYTKRPIYIAAQTYLTEFYQSLGFDSISDPYMLDGLPHIDMVLEPKKRKTIGLPKINNEINAKNVLINFVLLIIALGIIGLLYLLI